MGRLIFVFLFLLSLVFNFSTQTVLAASLAQHQFSTRHTAEAKNFAYDQIELEIIDVDDADKHPEAFPVGTKLYGKLIEHRGPRRISRDEIRKFKLEKALLPNAKTEKIDEVIKIRTVRKTETAYWAGNMALLGTAQVLAITVDFVSVGLPVARGGTAIWGMGHYMYEAREGESKLKEGAKGFVKGALLPFPFFVLKGDPLYIHPGSKILISKDRNKEYINACLIKRDNNIKLEAAYRDKYKTQ